MRRGRGTRRISIVATGVMAFGVFSFAPGEAHVNAFGTDISIGYSNGAFNGRVSSTKRCRKNRLVNVIKIRRNRPDIGIGSDLTNENGRWRVPAPSANGRYYAVVGRKHFGGYGHSHRCRAARSATIRL